MPWKQLRDSSFRLPSRQDLMIVGGALLICLLVIAYFILRS